MNTAEAISFCVFLIFFLEFMLWEAEKYYVTLKPILGKNTMLLTWCVLVCVHALPRGCSAFSLLWLNE